MCNDVFFSPGMFGDTIYAIPFCLSSVGTFKLEDIAKNKFTYLISLCVWHSEFGTDFALNTLQKLAQLLKTQPYIKDVVYGKTIHFEQYGGLDLGIIRKGRVSMQNGDISLRYRFLRRQFQYYSLDNPWLFVQQTDKYEQFKDKIIVFRTPRYRNIKIKNYSALKKYSSNLIYIGTDLQYKNFCQQSGLKPYFYKFNSLIQLCQIMSSCGFVVGNQTFFFSLAQSMKVPRLLEMSSNKYDVLTHGKYGNDFVDNQDFQILIDMYYKKFIEERQ